MRQRRRLAAGLGLAPCVLAGCSRDGPVPRLPDDAAVRPVPPEPSPPVPTPPPDLLADPPRLPLRGAVDLSADLRYDRELARVGAAMPVWAGALMMGRCGPRGADVPLPWIGGPEQ
jgi:hypothetical protein